MYENLNPDKLDKSINSLGKKTTVYFIGFCVLFVMVLFYSATLHYFFTALCAMIFIGILLLYYMIGYTFIRIVRLLQFDDNFMNNLLNNDNDTNNKQENNENIPEI
jgi:hypothetical protein